MGAARGNDTVLQRLKEDVERAKAKLQEAQRAFRTDKNLHVGLENQYLQANKEKKALVASKEQYTREIATLKEEAKLRGPSTPPAARTPTRTPRDSKTDASKAALQSHLLQVEQQVKEKLEDKQTVEQMLTEEIGRLKEQCQQLSKEQSAYDESAVSVEDKLRGELDNVKQTCAGGATKEAHFAHVAAQLNRSLEKQEKLTERLLQTTQEKEKLQQRKMDQETQWETRQAAIDESRARWQQEREVYTQKKQRLERVEQVLRQTNQSIQEKIEATNRRVEQNEIGRMTLRSKCQQVEANLARGDPIGADSVGGVATMDGDVAFEVRRLTDELEELMAAAEAVKSAKRDVETRCEQLKASIGQLEEGQRLSGSGTRSRSRRSRSQVSTNSARFRASLKGTNCSMTLDGTTATRTKGCRQCVVIGEAPLDLVFGVGWYFELCVNEVVSGWVGGLGLGVTLTKPGALATLPDRAWRIPRAWMAGYWGRMFTDGQQHLIDWKPQDLRINDKVGFLVTTKGECRVYVNGVEKVRFNEVPIPVATDGSVELVALVDVFASTASVTLCDSQPPEAVEEEEDDDDEDDEEEKENLKASKAAEEDEIADGSGN